MRFVAEVERGGNPGPERIKVRLDSSEIMILVFADL